MALAASDIDTALAARPDERAVRKAFRRLVPWCMLFYVLSYMDRINIGFAALTMNADLALSAQMFGFIGTGFYIFYSLCEVPSNVALARFGARIWIPRIMITWGIASAATMFATGPVSLFIFRALVGAAEAGLLPGLVYYLGQWFPHEHRARANSLFLAALPLALLIGAPLSGVILQMDGWLGLKGWQWLFLLEGLPSIAVGISVYFFLPDVPAQASWLTPEEKTALQSRLAVDVAAAPGKGRSHNVMQEIRSVTVLVLGLSYFCLVNTITSFSVWTPLIVQEVLNDDQRVLFVSLMSAIPPLFTVIIMQVVSWNSDRTGERSRHLIGAMLAAAAGWALLAASEIPALKFIGLTITFVGGYSALAIFWASASILIPPHRQAVAIALISTIGIFSSIISPSLIGVLRDYTGNFNSAAWYGAGLVGFGVLAYLVVLARQRRAPLV